MKLIKRHKKKIIIVLIAIFIIVIFFMIRTLFYTNGKSAYGDRLDGIEAVKISTSLKDDIINTLEAKENVDKAKINVEGKIINILLTVDASASLDAMKTISAEILSKFSAEEIAFYDFQIFVTQDTGTETGGFRLIGYKNVNSQVIVWSSNE
ncbi:MAG: hypothetical protein PHQ89_01985 [Bacilli bacterium]|nr:hypothetical protein [Bacilli bacterium]